MDFSKFLSSYFFQLFVTVLFTLNVIAIVKIVLQKFYKIKKVILTRFWNKSKKSTTKRCRMQKTAQNKCCPILEATQEPSTSPKPDTGLTNTVNIVLTLRFECSDNLRESESSVPETTKTANSENLTLDRSHNDTVAEVFCLPPSDVLVLETFQELVTSSDDPVEEYFHLASADEFVEDYPESVISHDGSVEEVFRLPPSDVFVGEYQEVTPKEATESLNFQTSGLDFLIKNLYEQLQLFELAQKKYNDHTGASDDGRLETISCLAAKAEQIMAKMSINKTLLHITKNIEVVDKEHDDDWELVQ